MFSSVPTAPRPARRPGYGTRCAGVSEVHHKTDDPSASPSQSAAPPAGEKGTSHFRAVSKTQPQKLPLLSVWLVEESSEGGQTNQALVLHTVTTRPFKTRLFRRRHGDNAKLTSSGGAAQRRRRRSRRALRAAASSNVIARCYNCTNNVSWHSSSAGQHFLGQTSCLNPVGDEVSPREGEWGGGKSACRRGKSACVSRDEAGAASLKQN